MQDITHQITALLHDLWHRRWTALAVAWAFALIAAIAILRLPDKYEATARVYVDTQTVLKPLIAGLAVQPDIDQMVAMLAKTMITRPNIERLLQDEKLGFALPDEIARARKTDELLTQIALLPAPGRENLYVISYRDVDRQRAERLVQNLLDLFVTSSRGDKTRDTLQARQFIDEQIRQHEVKLAEAENRLKEFKLRNFGFTGTAGSDYFARATTLTEDLNKVRVELRVAEQSRDALRRQLDGEEPILLPDIGPQTPAAALPEIDGRINATRRQLDELLRNYTDLHPDVVSSRRLLAQLEAQKMRELQARREVIGERSAARATANNPVYQQLKLAFAEAEANVASLAARARELQANLDQMRASAERVPKVEAEFAQLNRDYDVVRKNYESLVARRETAAISQDIDAHARLAEFRVVEPPHSSLTPVFPNRLILAPLALLASIALGVLAAFALVQFRPTFHHVRLLRTSTKRPVLGSVTWRPTPAALRRHYAANLSFAGGVTLLLSGYGLWIAVLAMAKPIAS